MDRRLLGRLLGHLSGLVGTMVAIDDILGKSSETYRKIFVYGNAGFLIGAVMIAVGARVVRENLRPKQRGPWWR